MSEVFPSIKDTPTDRVLNVFQGVEPLLIKYIESNPKDKELAKQVLSNVRKCLAGAFDALPEPRPVKPKPSLSIPTTIRGWGF